MKINKNTDCFFSMPLQSIYAEGKHLNPDFNYGYCSLFLPHEIFDEDEGEPYCLIKVYDFFSAEIITDIQILEKSQLLFGESIFVRPIPRDWKFIGKQSNIRRKEDYPDFKISSFPTTGDHEQRNWWMIKNALIEMSDKVDYQKVKHLEFGHYNSESLIKLRIYVEFIKRNTNITFKDIHEPIFTLLRKENSNKTLSDSFIRDTLMANFLYDFYFG
jgi:hypothetical protein